MASQWENFLRNLGEWQGSFTQFSPNGELLESTPSLLLLEGLEGNQKVRLTLRRFSSSAEGAGDGKVSELVREYNCLARDILFFENGAFSQGSMQLAPYSEFGAEFGFVAENRRLRLVQLYNSSGKLSQFTLIREMRAGTNATECPPLTLQQLLGKWQGEAVTLYPDWRAPDTYSTYLELHETLSGKVVQRLTFGSGAERKTIESIGSVSEKVLTFNQGALPIQVLLLPDGASATSPCQVKLHSPFFLEAGWLIKPDWRQRLIRSYNEKGEWISLTLVSEYKVSSC